MPIVGLEMIVRCRGKNGNSCAGEADGDGEDGGVDRLGHEQVRHPLDVGDHPPALADPRQRGEAVVEQHELGHAAAGAAARSPWPPPCQRP